MKINGFLMSEDTAVAEIRNGEVHILNPALVPLYFHTDTPTLSGWLKTRMIDNNRANSRILKRSLGVSDLSDGELALRVNAATITDTYWIRESGSELVWDDVRFQKNDFSNVALLGSFSDYGKPFSRTPELTNTGSFEKCWRLEDGRWWLYKIGHAENLFSEMAAFLLCKNFGYETAYYELVDSPKDFVGKLKDGQGLIRSLDFTRDAAVNFEPALSLGLSTDDSFGNYEKLKAVSEDIAEEYIRIVTMDTLIYNLDRHNQNFGVLRDVKTGAILQLAPNFDNNLSFLAGIHGMQERTPQSDVLFQQWKLLIQSNFIDMELPLLDSEFLYEWFSEISHIISKEELDYGIDFIMQGDEMMREVLEQMHRFTKGQNPQIEL